MTLAVPQSLLKFKLFIRLFIDFLTIPGGMRDLSLGPASWTRAPSVEVRSLNHWDHEVPFLDLYKLCPHLKSSTITCGWNAGRDKGEKLEYFEVQSNHME